MAFWWKLVSRLEFVVEYVSPYGLLNLSVDWLPGDSTQRFFTDVDLTHRSRSVKLTPKPALDVLAQLCLVENSGIIRCRISYGLA